MSLIERGMLGFYHELPEVLEDTTRYAVGDENETFSKPGKENLVSRKSDGAKFPHHEGEPLSWSPGLYHTDSEEKAGFPRMRAVIRAMKVHRPDQLRQEHHEIRKSAMLGRHNLFSGNAKKQLAVFDEEVGKDSYSQDDGEVDRYSQEFDDLIDRYARKMGFTKKHFNAFAAHINELHKLGKHSEADAIHAMVLKLNDNPKFDPGRFKAATMESVAESQKKMKDYHTAQDDLRESGMAEEHAGFTK